MEIIILIIIGILFVVPSFMAMRKQRQRQNEMQALQNSLQPGDAIVTAGGVHGVVRSTGDKDVDLEICLLYTSPSPRDLSTSRMPSSA